jgi:hypothetical protein
MAAFLNGSAALLLHELILTLKRDNAERVAREVARDVEREAREVARDAAREAREDARDAARDTALADFLQGQVARDTALTAFLQGQAARDSSLLRELRALTRPGMPPLVVVRRGLMRVLGLQSCAASGGAGGALLGAGASGRVFCVERSVSGSSAPRAGLLALKVSCLASQGDLAAEYTLMQAAAARGAPVASVVKGSLRAMVLPGTEQYAGGGYLLAEVLQHVPVTSLQRSTSAFAALQALHGCGMAHGDARLPNLLARRDGQLVWIDLCNAAGVAWSQRVDARQLAVSVLALGEEDALPGAVAGALQGVPQGGAPAYAALAAAVHAALLAK